MVEYYLRSTSSYLSDGGAFSKIMSTSYTSETSFQTSVPLMSTVYGYFYTESQVPLNGNWGTNSFNVNLYLSPESGVFLYAKVRITRVNYAGVVQESSDWSDEQQIASESQYLFSCDNIEWTSGNYKDRIRIDVAYRNASAATAYNMGTYVDGSSNYSYVESPINCEYIVYNLRSINSDLGGGSDFTKIMNKETGSRTAVTFYMPQGTTHNNYFITEQNVPDNDKFNTGATIVYFEVSSNAYLYTKMRLQRISASGTVLESSSYSSEQQTSYGGYIFEIPSKTWSAGNDTDRIRLHLVMRAVGGNAGGSVYTNEGYPISQFCATSIEESPCNLSGVTAAESSSEGYLSLNPSIIRGICDAVSNSTGNLGIIIPIAGQTNAVASLEGHLSTIIPLSGSCAAVSESTGAIENQTFINGLTEAEASSEGTLSLIRAIAGETVATSGSTGVLDVQSGLKGSLIANSSSEGNLTFITGLSGTTAAVSGSSGALSFVTMLRVQRRTEFTDFADHVFIPFTDGSFQDDIDLVGGETYWYRACKVVDQVSHDWSNITYATYASTSVLIEGTTSAISSSEGILTLDVGLAGTTAAVSASSGALSVEIKLLSLVEAESSSEGSLNVDYALGGVTVAESLSFGALEVGQFLIGETETVSSSSGSLSVDYALAGIAYCGSEVVNPEFEYGLDGWEYDDLGGSITIEPYGSGNCVKLAANPSDYVYIYQECPNNTKSNLLLVDINVTEVNSLVYITLGCNLWTGRTPPFDPPPYYSYAFLGSVSITSPTAGMIRVAIPFDPILLGYPNSYFDVYVDVGDATAYVDKIILTESATLDLQSGLIGTTAAEASSEGFLSRDIAIAGQTDAISGSSGIIVELADLVGDSSAVSSSSGSLSIDCALIGITAAESTSEGELTLNISLAGSSIAESATEGRLVGDVPFEGSCSAVSSSEGTITFTIHIAGTCAAESSSSATLYNYCFLSGTTAAVSSTAGHVSVIRYLYGQTDAVSFSEADLVNIQTLDIAGSCTAISGSEGILYIQTEGKEIVLFDSTISRIIEFDSTITRVTEPTSTITLLLLFDSTIDTLIEDESTITRILEFDSEVPDD